jgi:hypothetical protein
MIHPESWFSINNLVINTDKTKLNKQCVMTEPAITSKKYENYLYITVQIFRYRYYK